MEFDRAVIFDLDGVIVSTDEFHYQAWKKMAEVENIYFDRKINDRLRGVSRRESLNIILEKAEKEYIESEKQALTDHKNRYYRELIKEKLSPDDILPGVIELINGLKENNIGLAIGSSSKNTPLILERIGLIVVFDVIIDGNQISRSKPDPEVFLKASQALGVKPGNCLVIEDADAGVEAALNGGMKVLGVGSAATNSQATYTVSNLAELTLTDIFEMFG